MAIPSVKVTVNPKGIAIIPAAGGSTPLLLGASLSGPYGQILALANLSAVVNTIADGALADKAALDLSYGASQVLAWRMFSGSVDGTAYSAGETLHVANLAGAAVGTGTVSFKGAAAGMTPVILITTNSDATHYGAFDYSLDGGNSFTGTSTAFTAATSYALGASGITLILSSSTETAGLWIAGDSYRAGGVQSGATAGSGTVAVSGNPVAPYGNQVGIANAYNGLIVQITTSSTATVAGQFAYSMDGGVTWSAPQNIPTGLVYVIPNSGLTLTFSAQVGSGVWVSGDTIRARITGAVGVGFPYGSTGFSLLQVGATGSVASAKGGGTLGLGTAKPLGLTWNATAKAYQNAGTGSVEFYGAVGATPPIVKITTASDGASTNGDFEYSTDGGRTYSAAVAIPAIASGVSPPVELGGTGIWAIFSGGQTSGYFSSGAFVINDLYGVSLPSPVDEYNVQLVITADGTAESGACQYVVSFDGGLTFGPTQIMSSAAVNLGHGVVLTALDAGGAGGTNGFKTGDVYSFKTQPPPFTSTDVANVLAIVQGAPQAWGWVHVLGHSTAISGATSGFDLATLGSQLVTSMGLWWAANRFGVLAAMDAPPDSDSHNIDAGLIAEAPSLAVSPAGVGGVLMVGAGDAAVVSPVTGFRLSRAASWIATAEACAAPLGRDLADVSAGSVSGVQQLFRDEGKTPGLDAVGYTTLRTIQGLTGFYLTNGNILAASGDDIYLAQFRRVIDEAAFQAYQRLAQRLNASVRVIAGGTIDPRDANAIESDIAAAIMAKLRGQISGLSVQVDTAHDILADETLPVTVSITPLGYSKQITVEIGFSNDALSALAA